MSNKQNDTGGEDPYRRIPLYVSPALLGRILTEARNLHDDYIASIYAAEAVKDILQSNSVQHLAKVPLLRARLLSTCVEYNKELAAGAQRADEELSYIEDVQKRAAIATHPAGD